MTMAIAFHGSDARTFKGCYTQTVLPYWRDAFPNLVSYTQCPSNLSPAATTARINLYFFLLRITCKKSAVRLS
jgi:hypothetical protein